MLVLCVSWGFNQIAVKLALPDIPPMLQATFLGAGVTPEEAHLMMAGNSARLYGFGEW